MTIHITSFKRSVDLPKTVERLSVAVYQPKGFDYPKLDFFDIRQNGKWTRPRDFIPEGHDPKMPDDDLLARYFSRLGLIYMTRGAEIDKWFDSLDHDVALCCWCPYDQAAQRQLKAYGSFVCHTAVVGYLLQDRGIPLLYDGDREKMVKVPNG